MFYLSLGAGPFFRPLPSKMCLLLELLPLDTQFPWELSLRKKEKKKPVPGDGRLQGAGGQPQAAHCQPCPLPHGTEQAKAFVVC